MRQSAVLLASIVALPAVAAAQARHPDAPPAENYSVTRNQSVPVVAKKTRLPLIVFADQKGAESSFVPSGYMGDAESLKMVAAKFSAPVKEPGIGTNCLKIQYGKGEAWPYRVVGKDGWAGVFWLAPANNWAKIKGAGYDLTKAGRLSFWAKGDRGGEVIADIKMGGIVGPYPDTDAASVGGPLRLTTEWQRYTIDLAGKDMRHIIGGFCFAVRRADNPRGAIFYLDEIVYEAEESGEAAVEAAPAEIPAVADPELVSREGTAVPLLTVVIPFPTLQALSLEETEREIAKVIEAAAEHPEWRMKIEGHTDDTGPADQNMTNSFERAKLVADHLEQSGVDRSRMTVAGLGEAKPISPTSNSTRQGRLKNRRVEVIFEPK